MNEGVTIDEVDLSRCQKPWGAIQRLHEAPVMHEAGLLLKHRKQGQELASRLPSRLVFTANQLSLISGNMCLDGCMLIRVEILVGAESLNGRAFHNSISHQEKSFGGLPLHGGFAKRPEASGSAGHSSA
jgi:hypothetical protein